MQAGKLNTYRFCDNVWTFMLNDVEFREVQEVAVVDKVKIVACDGKSKYMTFFFIFMHSAPKFIFFIIYFINFYLILFIYNLLTKNKCVKKCGFRKRKKNRFL